MRYVNILTAACLIGMANYGRALAQPPTFDVVVDKVTMRELPSTITLVGTIEPLRRSVIGSEIAGLVESMPVRQGDRVERGDLIVHLNGDTLRFQLRQARAQLKADEAELERWEFEKARVMNLSERDQANAKEVADTTADYERARFAVEEQKAVVAQLETDLGKTRIAAPFTGYVVRRMTEVGEWVGRGGSVVEMLELEKVLVRVDVPEEAIAFVGVGDRTPVLVDALGETVYGQVKHIIRQADREAHTFPVEIEVDNSGHRLASGMFVRATVTAGPKREVPAVPKDAIVERDGIQYIAPLVPGERGGHAGVLQPVTTGADTDEWVAITSDNVRPGMDVIVRGTERMKPFPMPVRLVDEFGTPVERGREGERDRGIEGARDGGEASRR